MLSKGKLQAELKEKYGINKNVTNLLSAEDCDVLLALLNSNKSAEKLVHSFVKKNNELWRNNQQHGSRRSRAEKRLKSIQEEYKQLEKAISDIEKVNEDLTTQKMTLSSKQQDLKNEIDEITAKNQDLSLKVQTLTTHNDELVEINDQLKRDNKDLKNAVDQIRLRLARDTKMLLQYEDSEIRRALIRLFRWTLG